MQQGINNNLTIREASKHELQEISEMTQKAYMNPENNTGIITNAGKLSELVENFQQKKIKILVALLDQKIIGAIRYNFPETDSLYFSKLAVKKEYRNQGIGTQIVRRIELIAKEKKCKKILLDCMFEKGLVPYYENLGYKIDKIKKHQDHHDVDMSKNL